MKVVDVEIIVINSYRMQMVFGDTPTKDQMLKEFYNRVHDPYSASTEVSIIGEYDCQKKSL